MSPNAEVCPHCGDNDPNGSIDYESRYTGVRHKESQGWKKFVALALFCLGPYVGWKTGIKINYVDGVLLSILGFFAALFAGCAFESYVCSFWKSLIWMALWGLGVYIGFKVGKPKPDLLTEMGVFFCFFVGHFIGQAIATTNQYIDNKQYLEDFYQHLHDDYEKKELREKNRTR